MISKKFFTIPLHGICLLWGLSVLAGTVDPLQSNYLKGYNALQEGNYSEALEIYRPLAEAGHAESNMDLGVMHLEGWGTPKNPKKALTWIRQAGDKGSLRAQVLLGMILFKGMSSISADPPEAAKWIEKAASQGHAESALKLARMHERGMGVVEDLQQAYMWYGRAAKLGHPKGKEKQGKLQKELTSAQIEAANREITSWNPKSTSKAMQSPSLH